MAHLNTADLGKIQDALMSRDPAACMVAQALICNARDGLADPSLREAANDEWATDDLEIDDEPATSEADGGTWVAAWVWMPGAFADEDDAADEPCPIHRQPPDRCPPTCDHGAGPAAP